MATKGTVTKGSHHPFHPLVEFEVRTALSDQAQPLPIHTAWILLLERQGHQANGVVVYLADVELNRLAHLCIEHYWYGN